jgi:anti-sigma B factor antagonist
VRLEAETHTEAGRVVVTLSGECDLDSRERLSSILHSAVDSGPVVFVDLTGLLFLDSSGVHGLVEGHHTAVRNGKRLYVTNAGGAVAHVLDITGVSELLRAPAGGNGPPGVGPT